MPERINYRMVRPPGWSHIQIGESAPEQVAAVARSISLAVDEQNRAMAELFLRDQLTSAVDQSVPHGGQDLFFPTEPVNGFIIPMSIIVALPPLPAGAADQPRMHALTSFAAKSPMSTVQSIAGQPSVRATKDVAAVFDDVDNLISPATRQVSYVMWAPGASNRLITFAGSLVRLDSEDGAELCEALEFLFDAIIDTVRFDTEEVASE